MNRRRLWWTVVAALAGAVAFAAWLPGYRLGREIAAARAEGLWTEAADVRHDAPESSRKPKRRAPDSEGGGPGEGEPELGLGRPPPAHASRALRRPLRSPSCVVI